MIGDLDFESGTDMKRVKIRRTVTETKYIVMVYKATLGNKSAYFIQK